MIRRAAAASAALVAAMLWGCLLQQPLGRPEEAYDLRSDLGGDSLSRFDSVEVWLEDADDSGLVLLFKGRVNTADDLGAGLAEGGRKDVYVVRGYKRDRGACFLERQTRDGSRTVLRDTCALPGPVDPPRGGEGDPPKRPLPRFASDTLYLSDSVPARVSIRDAGDSILSIRAEGEWLGIGPDGAGTVVPLRIGRDSLFWARAGIDTLEAGKRLGRLILSWADGPLDTLIVTLTIGQRYLRGRVADWNEDRPLEGVRVELEDGSYASTGASGEYALAVGATPARHAVRFTAPGRIGVLDTLYIKVDPARAAPTRISPAGTFRAVNLVSERSLAAVAAAAGYAIVLSTPPMQAGRAFLVRLDVSPPRYEKEIDLRNDDGDPENTEYFDAGEMLADSDAIFIAYPEANRLGRIGDWRGTPRVQVAQVPLQPGGLLRDGDRLLTLGRLANGTLALARFRAEDLSLIEIDTLSGYAWDGVMALDRSPKLAAGPDAYYAVDGNGPNPAGRLLRLDKADGSVTAKADLPEGELNDLAWVRGTLYVGGLDAQAHWLRGFDAALRPVDSIEAGVPIDRIAGASSGRLGGYGFATPASDRAANDTLLVFAPRARKPLGKIPVPGAGRLKRIALYPPARIVLATDGAGLYSSSF